MEISPSKNEALQAATKQKITEIYQNFDKNSCTNQDCINRFCKSGLKNMLGKNYEEELTHKE